MKLFPPNPEVYLYNEGFGENDLLGRKKVGQALSDLVERIDDPLVIALEGRWGSGKTHFLKRWVGAHTLENGGKAATIYFDAFESDYQSDPLPALIAALVERFPKSKKRTVAELKKAAWTLIKPAARVGLAVGTYGATEVFAPAADVAVESLSDQASKAVEAYWSREEGRRAALSELKAAISALAEQADQEDEKEGASLVFVIDELDRCRPEYALEVLEVIKHVFSVPSVHFVLGVNSQVLQNSVSVKMGSKIDAEAYLRKFVDLTLKLPTELGEEHNRVDVTEVYLQDLIKQMGTPKNFGDPLLAEVKAAARGNSVSIRDIGKIVSAISLMNPNVLTKENWLRGWVDTAVGLVVARILDPSFYEKLLAASASDAELMQYYGVENIHLQEKEGEERNPLYRPQLVRRIEMWKFLRDGSKYTNENRLMFEHIAAQFDRFSMMHEPLSIPSKIAREWIDVFEFGSA